MAFKAILPQQEKLESIGRVSYSESLRAWARIRLKKDVIRDFPVLKQRESRFLYRMLFYRSYVELERELRKMRRTKQPLPFLLFIEKEKPKE